MSAIELGKSLSKLMIPMTLFEMFMQELIIKRIKTTCRHDNFLHSFIENLPFCKFGIQSNKTTQTYAIYFIDKDDCLSLNSFMLM